MPTADRRTATATRRAGILAYVVHSVRTEGRPPTQREIAAMFDVSQSQAKKDVNALIAAGKLDRDPGIARGLRLPTRRRRSA